MNAEQLLASFLCAAGLAMEPHELTERVYEALDLLWLCAKGRL